jgi:hypothetical protein
VQIDLIILHLPLLKFIFLLAFIDLYLMVGVVIKGDDKCYKIGLFTFAAVPKVSLFMPVNF